MKRFTLLEYSLFQGIPAEHMEMLLSCIDARMRFYKMDDDLMDLMGEETHTFLILSGHIRFEMENGNILRMLENMLFHKDALETVGSGTLLSCKADTDLTILSMDRGGITKVCWFSCFFHHLLAENAERHYGLLKEAIDLNCL